MTFECNVRHFVTNHKVNVLLSAFFGLIFLQNWRPQISFVSVIYIAQGGSNWYFQIFKVFVTIYCKYSRRLFSGKVLKASSEICSSFLVKKFKRRTVTFRHHQHEDKIKERVRVKFFELKPEKVTSPTRVRIKSRMSRKKRAACAALKRLRLF